MRDNFIFILVYSVNKERRNVQNQYAQLGNAKIKRMQFEKFYFKSAVMYSDEEFEKEFINKYCVGWLNDRE